MTIRIRAISLLNQLAASAEAGGRNGSLVKICTLQAAGFQQTGQTKLAVTTLEKALAIAEAEGYIRTVIDEGGPVAALLAHMVRENRSPHSQTALRLMERIQNEPRNAGWTFKTAGENGRGPGQVSSPSLIEPLSRREIDVLRCMAAGLSNQETAKKLVIEIATVKRHINSIFAKLGVNNRVLALNQAKELKIIG